MPREDQGVLGFGRTGESVARALRAEGHRVVVWDDCSDARHRAEAAGFALGRPDGNLEKVIASPGIAPSHPALQRAHQVGVPVVGDIELLWQRVPGSRVIGVTGTNGKTTTVTLIDEFLRASGIESVAGGNLGRPALSLPRIGTGGAYVLELSSFQLARTCRFRPAISVLLNIGTDHLDWHGDRARYVAAKRRLFRNQRVGDAAVIGVDDTDGRDIARDLVQQPCGPRVVPVSVAGPQAGGVGIDDDMLVDDLDGEGERVVDLTRSFPLPGLHNRLNVAAAYAASRLAGASADALKRALPEVKGLPHRVERVDTVEGVTFVNDSKATNVAAAVAALRCFDRVCWIGGGRAKDDDLAPLVALAPRMEGAFLLGEASGPFAEALAGHVPVQRASSLTDAVRRAFRVARSASPPVPVLLSPACASYDQFRDYEERGRAFRRAVRQILGGRP